MKKNYFIAILLMVFVNLFAQHKVTITFKDDAGNLLPGVTMRMKTSPNSGTVSMISDVNGKVVYAGVLDSPTGGYAVNAPTLNCYKGNSFTVTVAGQDVNQDVILTALTTALKNDFSVTAFGTGVQLNSKEGTAGVAYQWYDASVTPPVAIAGATARTYDVGAAGSGTYQVKATCGALSNTPAPQVITMQPVTIVVKDAGTPVEGAKVTISSAIVNTDASGKATFALAQSAAAYTASVTMPCYTTVSKSITVSGPTADIDVAFVAPTLNNAVTVSKNIITATQNNSGTGVTYQWVNSTSGTDVDIDGATAKSYTVPGPGKYRVKIMDCTRTAANPVVSAVTEVKFFNANFTVTDGTNPMQGATVTIGGFTAQTDAEGKATMALASGKYSYTVTNANNKCYGTFTSATNADLSTADANVPTVALSLTTKNTVNVALTQSAGTTPLDFKVTLTDVTDASKKFEFITGSYYVAGLNPIENVPFGDYSYTITRPCYKTMEGTIKVDCGNGLPNVLSETPTVDIDAAVTKNGNVLTVNATGARYTYQWFDTNGLAIEGATGQTYTATRTGNYKVQVTTVDCGTSVTSDEVSVIFKNAVITVNDTKGTAIEGATVTMGAIVKKTAANGKVIFSVVDGDYSYVITNDCYVDLSSSLTMTGTGVSKTEVLSHIQEPVSVLVTDASETPNVIDGAVVTLTAEGYTQNVTTAAGAAAIFPADVPYGTYTYRIVTNCYDVKEGTLTVQCNNGEGFQINAATALTVVDKTVTQDGKTLTATATGKEYQWFNCADNTPIEGATAQTFTATTAGNYKVVITNPACTVSATSDCFEVTETILGLEHNAANVFSVYPNPVTDNLTVQMNNDFQNVSVEVVNMMGQVVLKTNFSQIKTMKLDVSDLGSGFYILNVKADNQSSSRRIIKQ